MQFQLGSNIHACTNETHSLANLHYRQHKLAKVGLYIYWRACFNCACMDVATQLELCLHEQTQTVANAICRVGSQQFLS